MNELRINRKIKSLQIKNVNNHEESEYHFHEHLNLIVGSSENGKSASVRALVFALYNQYNGDLVNWDEKFAQVTIEFVDGAIIKRTKGKDINRVEYKYAHESDFTVYKSFGTDYPDDVWNFLGNPPRYIESKPIAYADQHSKTFLVDLKPTQLPAVFSELTGVEDLEECSSVCNSKIKGFEKSNKALETEIKELEEKLESEYVDLDNDILLLEELEEIISEIASLESEISGLQSYLKDYKRIIKSGNDAKNEIDKCKQILEFLPDVNSLGKEFEVLKAMQNMLYDTQKTAKKISKYDKQIKIDKMISEGDLANKIDVCDKEFSTLELLIDMNNSYISIQDKITKKGEAITTLTDTIATNSDSLDKLIKEAVEKGAICSKCMKIGGEYVG